MPTESGPALRRRIGYVFQEVGLFPHMTVAENIAVGPRLAGWDKAPIAPRVAELLRAGGAAGRRLARGCRRRSRGGQRQRVGVARALAAKPAIMLMDEPFGALDPVTRDGSAATTAPCTSSLGLTTLMVTHDVWEALLLADRIVVMDQGKVLADATPAALLAGHADERVRALMETPRAAGRAGRGRWRASRLMDPRIAAAWALLPGYLGQHVLLSPARCCWASPSACRWRWRPAAAPWCAGPRCWSPAWCRPSPAWPCWRCSTRCCWRSRR